jgi:transposase
MLNKYIKYSKISEAKFREILRYFSSDLEVTKISEFTKISRQTISKIVKGIRIRIAGYCEENVNFKDCKIKIFQFDESYFGARRVKGKRGRGASGKIPVFGIYSDAGVVYTRIVEHCTKSVLEVIITDLIDKDSVLITDGFKSYDGLLDLGYKAHYRVKHSANEFATNGHHINGIENFWCLCKVRLAKFRGIRKDVFYLHLKECEFRHNCRLKQHKKLIKTSIKNY